MLNEIDNIRQYTERCLRTFNKLLMTKTIVTPDKSKVADNKIKTGTASEIKLHPNIIYDKL